MSEDGRHFLSCCCFFREIKLGIVVEGLQQCLRNLGYIQNSISTPYNIRFSRLEVAILEDYRANIDEIIDVLRSLLHQWELHIDSLQTAANDMFLL